MLLLGSIVYLTKDFSIKQEPKKEVMAIDISFIPPPKQEPMPKIEPFEAYDEEVSKDDGKSHKEVADKKPPQKKVLPKPKEPQPQIQEVPKEQPKPQPKEVVKVEQPSFPSLQEIGAALQKQEVAIKEQREFNQNQRELQQLYGSEYESLTSEQKKFLTTNIKTIQSITQRHLNMMGYPEIAIRTRQNGVNVVEFNLYANGDISDLRLVEYSGYRALDTQTIELIKRAYKDYPYPNQKTLVRIKVIYNAF